MSLVVLVILAVVWAVFLLPQLFRARAERSTDSIGIFRHQLSVLERTTPAGGASITRLRPAQRPHAARTRPAPRPTSINRAPVARPHHSGRALARKRRRDVLCGLMVAMGASLVLSLIPALRMMLVLHLLLDGLFVVYIALLVRARNLATERDLKVRFLPTPTPQPQLLLRRSAN
ncbi:MAG: hypothetical protein KY439_11215 [Actinobacteria bacterium]|nr:hypothetical protein [Actinomycetota bacterium]